MRKHGTNGIEITVGGKGSGSYTIPYATKSLQDKDGKDIDKTYAKICPQYKMIKGGI